MRTKFINPYNFIPLGKQKSVYQSEESEKGLTGEISYSLITRTPLFIPDTEQVQESKEVEGHKLYPFFSGNVYKEEWGQEVNVPIIPGSEIRGMFRSYFEILSNSCMSALDSDTQLSKRTSEVFKPGLLKKVGDRFMLYEAESLRYQPYSGYKNIESAGNTADWNVEQTNRISNVRFTSNEAITKSKTEGNNDTRKDAAKLECTKIFLGKKG